ncbi:MAG: VOC family protein [Candidatus Obscuribacterales bacterium]|nr:VOC family protein [Candidatus Obscuribacterales bacterium]
MKKMHVNLNVKDLDKSVEFYSTLFEAQPEVVKPGYVKWVLTDPPLNFSIVIGEKSFGINHIGFQCDSHEEVKAIGTRLKEKSFAIEEEANVECCYARSSKVWTEDPQNVRWENFITVGESNVLEKHEKIEKKHPKKNNTCCNKS